MDDIQLFIETPRSKSSTIRIDAVLKKRMKKLLKSRRRKLNRAMRVKS